jgi:hypothetical protein
MKRPMCLAASLLACTFLMVPSAPANDDPACAALETSALTPPDWYANLCLADKAMSDQAPADGPWRVPGDLAIYLSNFSPNAALSRRLLSAPLPTATYTNIAPCGANPLNIFALDFDNAASVLWAIDSGCSTGVCTARSLGTINQTTGVFTVTAQVTGPPSGSNFSGLKFDPTSNTVYISVIAGGASSLWTLNMTTGAATQVGGPITGFLIDIAIDRTGVMYGHEILNDQLLRIDKTTGVATLVGPTGQAANFAQGMDFDPTDNTLYAFLIRGDAGFTAAICTVNLTTGAFTPVTVNGEELEGAVKLAAARMTALSLLVDNAGNKVMEPGETATVAPTWRNDGGLAQTNVTGAFSNFTGPVGPTYSIVDGTGAYGTIAAGASGTCTDCYSVMASGTRPQQHWDSAVLETLSVPGQQKTWTLHIGESFTDVPATNGFYRFVETIFHKGITGGCGVGTYCPTSSTTREQMAVFVLVSKEGAGYNPPACAPPNLFSDVPETSPFCKFIEELANRLVVTGCGPNLYCPSAAVTREAMAVFALRTLDPTLNPPDCTTPMFADVPATSPFCKWIEELARRGVVSGCGGGNYCPSQPVTREQMGVFLAATFSLVLYGV